MQNKEPRANYVQRKQTYHIVKDRFDEMIRNADGYFTDDNGNYILGKNTPDEPERRLSKRKKKDIAALLGIAPQTLSNNLNNKHAPSTNTLEQLAYHYNVDWHWLCGIEDEEQKLFDKLTQSFNAVDSFIDSCIDSFQHKVIHCFDSQGNNVGELEYFLIADDGYDETIMEDRDFEILHDLLKSTVKTYIQKLLQIPLINKSESDYLKEVAGVWDAHHYSTTTYDGNPIDFPRVTADDKKLE